MSLIVSRGLGSSGASAYPPCLAFLITGIFPNINQILLTLTSNFTASGPGLDPASYVVTTSTPGASAVTVTNVQVAGMNLLLTTTNQTDGAAYVLHMPSVGLVDVNLNPFNGPFSNNFTGVGLAVAILIAYSIDVVTLGIVYNQPVNEASATNISHYNISPTLDVTAAVRMTDYFYQLTTSDQTRDQIYIVTATGVLPK